MAVVDDAEYADIDGKVRKEGEGIGGTFQHSVDRDDCAERCTEASPKNSSAAPL